MDITELIGPGGVVANLRVTSKKQALQELAKRAAGLTGQPERAIFEVLIERERLGTTGVGNGIAIPHGKLADLDRLYGLFARLETPIDFDAIDEQPVDLICVLLSVPRSLSPITSRPWPGSRACCATGRSATSCAAPTAPRRSVPC